MNALTSGIAAAAIAATAITLSACSSSGTEVQVPNTSSTVASPAATASDAHNQADVMFAEQMIPHHEQAIEMSDIMLAKKDIDPDVITLANQIKAAQSPEIEQMRGWLDEWGVAADVDTGEGPMGGHDMGDMPMGGMTMHGMLSQEQMSALRDAQDTEAARLYLTGMIEHHQGAIMMAQHEITHGQFPATVELARTIARTQQAEIDSMKRMLENM